MRTIQRPVSIKLFSTAATCLLAALTAPAANDTWNGGSVSGDNWSDTNNWGGATVLPGDFLFFDGGTRLTPNNDFAPGTIFGELNFNATAAGFTVGGNGVVLTTGINAGNGLTSGGNITNLSSSAQTVNLPVTLSAGNHTIAATGGALNFSGAVTRNPGAIAQFASTGGSINLTGSGLTTVNGILGGWALFGVAANAGDWATHDGSGNVIAYTGYTGVTGAPTLPNTPGANVKWTATSGNATIAAGVNDMNTLMFADNNTRVITNSGTLRLGAQGAIYMANGSSPSNNKGLMLGSVANQGVLTAGGGAGAAGEISLYDNSFVGANNDLTINSVVADNGGFPVTVNIMGYCVLQGANTYSGGTYVLQGRCQSSSGTCYGTGPVYIFPGAQVSMAVAATWTNEFYIAGLGSTESAGLGAIRLAGRATSGTIHLMSTAAIGGGGTMTGKITGNGGLIFGNGSVTGGSGKTTIGVAASPNDYAGDTLINNSTFATGVNTLAFNANANNVMPHGSGKGNVLVNGGAGGSKGILDLSGTTQTINGLVSTGTVANISVTNSTGTGVLIFGDNDAVATYKGLIMGSLTVTKIGNGTQALGGANTYSGVTTVNGGALALVTGASLPNTPQINVNSNATFDVSAVCPFGLGVSQSLTISNGFLSVSLLSTTNAVTVSTLNLNGTTNFIHLASIPTITSYPAQFTALKYTTANGALNFGLDPNLPVSPGTPYAGYVINNTANNSVDVVLTAGPSAIKWSGYSSGAPNSSWDTSTLNWKFFDGTPAAYAEGLLVAFDDSASNGVVTLNQNVSPSAITVSNSALAYVFNGGNAITGATSLTKQGGGSLIVDNSGNNDFTGGVNIAGGSLQIGNNDSSGNLPATVNIVDNGALIYARNDTVTVSNTISGSGAVTNNGSGTLVLAGANTFTGTTFVAQGTLQIANNSALGATNGGTIIAGGATLDINGVTGNTRRLGAEPIVVSGSGSGGAGAIVNNGADAFPAMSAVTLAGTTTFGGAGRWDIRPLAGTDPGTSKLLTSGNAYNLIKAGGNFFGISDSTIDPMLGDVDVQGGTFNFQGNNTGLGNPANTLTIESGATFELYAATNQLNKNIVVQDSAYILNGNGANTIIGPITLADVGFINVGGVSLTLNGPLSGSGIMSLNGIGQLIVNGNGSAFTGAENLNFGTLTLNGILGGNVTGLPGTTFGGSGTNLGPVDLYGNLYPGGASATGKLTVGSLNLESGAAPTFDLTSTNDANGGLNDTIQVNGDLIANGNTINVNFLQGQPQNGVYHLFTYSGTLVNGPGSSFNPTVSVPGGASRYGLALDYNTPNQVNLVVSGGPGSLVWNTTSSSSWDTFSSQNWSNLTTHVSPDYFYSGDSAWFTDLPGVVTNITITTAVAPSVLTNDAATNNFNFSGGGKITGTAGIVKSGASTMTLGTVNDFTGNVLVSGGILQMNANGALGATNGAVTITNGGTLDIGGPSFAVNTVVTGLKQFYVSGWGVNSNGAIINSSVNYQYAANDMLSITLQGDTAIGGPGLATPGNGNVAGRWDMRAGSLGNPVLSTSGNAYNFYKVGSNQFVLYNVAVDTNLANIGVKGGFLEVQGTTTLGNPTNKLTVDAGATFGMYASTTNLNKSFVLNGDGQTYSIFSEGGGNQIAGPIALNGSCVIGCATVLTNLNVISGTGNLVKFGASVLYLTGTNTYTGSTLVSTGTVALLSNGSISASTNLTVSAGATLSASGRTDGTLTLAGGQNLNGFGAVAGNLAANSGAVVAPGSPTAIGTLTVNGSATLGGTTTMKVDKVGGTRDLLTSMAAVTYGGTLNVVALTGTFALNDSFKLFNGTTYTGTFTVNPATPGSGLIWDTSSLNVNGTLKVTSAVNLNPTNITVVVTGGNLNLSWPPDHTGWRLQVQTNSLSTGLGTNWVDVPGSATTNAVSIPINPANGAVFYRMIY